MRKSVKDNWQNLLEPILLNIIRSKVKEQCWFQKISYDPIKLLSMMTILVIIKFIANTII